ncbi:2-amino-4-ketopentanoate thiolase [Thermosipho affectus]|uniref:2-amino-4-ketopentanoate thiolase n=1 Tax=Thermosipho affectus TaxID=660294 RepID=A0ABX3IJ18_9BACT|nr:MULTISPECIES: 2-amino-4-oxopentanoate thiolase subunit OrtB [Thermosipho]ANQ53838.1 2-amino-4-ketopentanoate thiolase subunit beta [Thermosipho sp. 1070]ONN27191.1 2-amino-4-ketopentanoate thiolase [Thermosipho affectus]OOC43531.1 2-amino-4-ketopentanoate thiolase [Thermosipho sp. 1074]
MSDLSYNAVMSRKNEIMKRAVGIDYEKFIISDIVFDYEKMMQEVGYSLEKVREIQQETGVGNTPLVELKQINRLIKKIAPKGKGARIFIKDEATNPSGSYKDRRASVSVYHAQKHGYKGVIAATSGNYGAAVASQAAKRGLKCIIVQECYDSKWIGQPEILEKARACEAYGAEVVQLTVGPELFYYTLVLLEKTGFFNASLYTPYAIAGVETLGYEIAKQTKELVGKYPDAVVITHAGGGILTGTARGLKKAGAVETQVVAASVNLKGLHMASDNDFNKKYFTTGHTGFGLPFATFPDRSDVPKNAARALRYMDKYLLVSQGEVFYITEMLAQLEGMQRGPAGNTSLAAAFALALEMDEDKVIVVNETEYTGAGKLPSAQLTFAKKMGMEIKRGDPINEDLPGKRIVIPEHPSQIGYIELNMDNVRKSYVKEVMKRYNKRKFSDEEIKFMAEDTKTTEEKIMQIVKDLLGGE